MLGMGWTSGLERGAAPASGRGGRGLRSRSRSARRWPRR
ncbi:hypothetical protein R2601_03163 [Salipiger bermudensis HTCC2601]|uniref:Uncharacterized protein n=1 Tax=Salipiger bermudensis (strain DSM 26914 / JCM 13377 / KCTC 12554 / HTCC2601) TaxID=314265 RepID=Q0FWL3_SALBH|nr:hypothetical protein R2601_03163 [Salipiger bermudensis HTCC2601]